MIRNKQLYKHLHSTIVRGMRIVLSVWAALSCSIAIGQDAGKERFLKGDELIAAIEDATVAAIQRAEQSVVAITRVRRDRELTSQTASLSLGNLSAIDSPQNPDFVPMFFGSGVVISSDGFIVTCAHVLDDPRRNDYFVWLDRRCYPARVVGKSARVLAADPFSDLAILKIDAQGLSSVALGDAEKLQKGQFVVSLGNPDSVARDGRASASWGIVSNLQRVAPAESTGVSASKESIHQFGTLIQTDASLYAGTSGGALVNLEGELVGVSTSLVARKGSARPAGFAIAVDSLFRRVIGSLKQGRLPEYGFLGIEPEDLNRYERERGYGGARVRNVMPGLPADIAGIRVDDIIYEVNTIRIEDRNDLFRELSKVEAGAEVGLRVHRDVSGRSDIGRTSLPLRATLSKKYVGTRRPGYSIHPPPVWRGLLVDYSTAIPIELMRVGQFRSRRQSVKVTVVSVEPGSQAWNAGLRPGDGIVSAVGNSIESPAKFLQQVEQRSGDVPLNVARADGSIQTLVVLADKVD